MTPACRKLRHMSHASFLLAASCGSGLASNARCASGEIATTGSAALARVDTATRATAPTSNLMKSLLVLVVGVGAGTSAILSCHTHEQAMRRLSPIHYTGPFAAMPYHCFSRAATAARH